jgi:hypothetical protein
VAFLKVDPFFHNNMHQQPIALVERPGPAAHISNSFHHQTRGEIMQAKFPLGQAVITPNALNALHPEDVPIALGRHVAGDWGDLDDEDKQTNEEGLKHGLRLLSAYTDRNGIKFWIITEHDRSVTTVLLPEDY